MRHVPGILAVLLAVTLAGCQNMPWQRDSDVGGVDYYEDGDYDAPIDEPGLAMSPDTRFQDIPLPDGLREVPEQTYVYETRNLRMGRMVYNTRHSIADLSNFFLKHTPAAGWEVVSVVEGADVTLKFAKEGRELTVDLKERGMLMGRRVVINYTPASGR